MGPVPGVERGSAPEDPALPEDPKKRLTPPPHRGVHSVTSVVNKKKLRTPPDEGNARIARPHLNVSPELEPIEHA